MEENVIMEEIRTEVKRSKKQLPVLPDHVMARAAIIAEDSGELLRACRNHKYEASSREDKERWKMVMKRKAIQTAASCFRFLEALSDLK